MSDSRGETNATIASIGEHALIDRVRQRAGIAREWVHLGIGDDAAVIQPDRSMLDVVTTDSLVEGVHFRLDWTSARAVGHKALAVNLSDLAAMGATPRASLLSLALPAGLRIADFDNLIEGFVAVADESKAPLVGGNLTRSPGPLVINVTAMGSARRRRLLTRASGLVGDELYVTGRLGAAAAGLAMLETSANRTELDGDQRACVEHYERPVAQLRCGRLVSRSGAATACVDVSDGLADAAQQLASASQTGVVLTAATIPIHPGAIAWASHTARDPLTLALSGGEDYELLFAVRPRQRRKFLAATRRCHGLLVTHVGRLAGEPGAWLDQNGRLEPLGPGFVHF